LLVHIGDPSSNQATTLESQMIHMIQELFGQTLRELGGFIWIQITALIIFIRVVFSTIATGWRYRRRE